MSTWLHNSEIMLSGLRKCFFCKGRAFIFFSNEKIKPVFLKLVYKSAIQNLQKKAQDKRVHLRSTQQSSGFEGKNGNCISYFQMSENFFIIDCIEMSTKECKNWSEYEDQALLELKKNRGIKKWSQISQLLKKEFHIEGKSGKRCRDRYLHRLDSSIKKGVWTEEQQLALMRLHNQKGNSWMDIARDLERSDNDVKNHFHSKFRKAIRQVNHFIQSFLKGEFKPLKDNIVSKILKTSEEFYNEADRERSNAPKMCYDLKNKFFDYLEKDNSQIADDLDNLKSFIKETNNFNKLFKRKRKSPKWTERPENQSNRCRNKASLQSASQYICNSDSVILKTSNRAPAKSVQANQAVPDSKKEIPEEKVEEAQKGFNMSPFMYHNSSMMFPFGGNFPMVPPYWHNRYPPIFPGPLHPPFGMSYLGPSGKKVDDQDRSKALKRNQEDFKIKTQENENVIKWKNFSQNIVCKEEQFFPKN